MMKEFVCLLVCFSAILPSPAAYVYMCVFHPSNIYVIRAGKDSVLYCGDDVSRNTMRICILKKKDHNVISHW